MLVEKHMPRYEGEEDRVPGLGNLSEIIDLSSMVAKKGKTHKGYQDGGINAEFIGIYRGSKYQVKYRLFHDGNFEELEITGLDIGITIFHGHLILPPFRVTVDYYYGKRDVREILHNLKPVVESVPEEQAIESHPINRNNNAPIGILAILGGAHYIFAKTEEEAGYMYASWCEENEDFVNMRNALANPRSKLTPFRIRPLGLFPYYRRAAEKRVLEQSQGNDPQRRLTYWFGSK